MKNIQISGFADEISSDFRTQLEKVTALSMHYISLRSADGKNIADYTENEVKEKLLPLLEQYQVKVSSIGSPIGKVDIRDEEGFEKQKRQLCELCKIAGLLECRYVRIFSFFTPEGENPDDYRGIVIEKLRQFLEIAREYDVILLHENEKGIYGDIGRRCLELFEALPDEHLRAAFDYANFVQCKEDTAKCWELLRPYIVYIHIKDALYASGENVKCGTGDGKIRELLRQAILEEGYEGFLTLEPHLVNFAALASLEKGNPDLVIKKNQARTGEEGYEMQYHALCEILEQI
ncbi:MAG: sugar phosphate isomerase/epimerase [Clostridiales bacterium]|nr:sugar phosphate isomerase/epimerase [Clostridiales bacterium]